MANMPIKKFISGNIQGAIWLNSKEIDGNKTEYKTVSITRSYKKKDEDVWRNEILNIRRSDLPKIMTILHKLHEELYLTEQGGGDDD